MRLRGWLATDRYDQSGNADSEGVGDFHVRHFQDGSLHRMELSSDTLGIHSSDYFLDRGLSWHYWAQSDVAMVDSELSSVCTLVP